VVAKRTPGADESDETNHLYLKTNRKSLPIQLLEMYPTPRKNDNKKMQESLLCSSSYGRPKIQTDDSSVWRSLWTIGLLGVVFGFMVLSLLDLETIDDQHLALLRIGAILFPAVLAAAAARRHAAPRRDPCRLFILFLSHLAGFMFGCNLSLLIWCRFFGISIRPLLYRRVLEGAGTLMIIYLCVQVCIRIGARDESKEEPGRFREREILANTV
jgi:hypothetical protein